MGKGNKWVWGGGGSSSRQCVQCNNMREGDGRRREEKRHRNGDMVVSNVPQETQVIAIVKRF